MMPADATCGGRSSTPRRKILLVSHFPLEEITGVTVILSEIVRLWPNITSTTELAHLSLSDLPSRALSATRLDAHGMRPDALVGVNLHIEVEWERSLDLFSLCRAKEIAAYNYVHDYWPHHRSNVERLTAGLGVQLLASTKFISDLLRQAGFGSTIVPVGVRLPDDNLLPDPGKVSSGLVGAAGRLSPRKRFPDIVRGFCDARQEGQRLYLKLLPSLVFNPEEDAAQLLAVTDEISRGRAEGFVDIDRKAAQRHDYSRYSLYVCASSYEGFSMTPIEAAYCGCPPLMSEIPAHRRIAEALFGDHADEFMFQVGDTAALTRDLRDELTKGRRRLLLAQTQAQIRKSIATRWSLETTVRALAGLVETSPHD